MNITRSVDIKNANKLKILNVVKDSSPLSRADIAVKLSLSRSTVSLIIDELIEDGWIEELGLGESTDKGGKRPILLQTNIHTACIIAAFFTSSYSNLAITDLAGEIIVSKKITYSHTLDHQTRFDDMIDVINELIEECKINDTFRPIIGCGIVIRGLVDVENKTLLYSSSLKGWNNIPIGRYFSERLQVPVFVENDIRSITSYEYSKYKQDKPKVLMCINSENGIALGVAIDGNIYYGSRFGVSATHSILDVNGPLCQCGNHGCWDTIASIDVMMSEVEKKKKSKEKISYEELLKLYEAKDQDVIDVLKNYTGFWMSIGVVNALNNYNPDTLILLGEIFETFQEVGNCVIESINKMPNEIAKKVRIIMNDRKKDLLLRSSANLVLARLYSNENHDEIASCFAKSIGNHKK